jgi:hypothetical protein
MAVSILLLVILGSLAITAIVVGQVGGGFDLSWSTITGGGSASSGGSHALNNSLGQPVASNTPSTDGERYSLTDGFWQVSTVKRAIYLPIVIGGS